MTELSPRDARIANLRSELSGTEFVLTLRQAPAFREQPPTKDPLRLAVEQITANGAFSQSRLLLRILVTLATGAGEFRRAELSTFDSRSLALAIGLADAHAAGLYPPAAWTQAIAAAQAATA
jgi:hypothetical protein